MFITLAIFLVAIAFVGLCAFQDHKEKNFWFQEK